LINDQDLIVPHAGAALEPPIPYAARAKAEGRRPAPDDTSTAPQTEAAVIHEPDQGVSEYIPVPGRSPLPPRRRKRRARPRRRKRGKAPGKPALSIEQILQWADAHYAAFGVWPGIRSGAIPGAGGDTWQRVEVALSLGARGLPGGSSLAKLLQEARGKRNRKHLPPLSDSQILKWAIEHRSRTGKWPTARSGEVVGAPGETWAAVHHALASGLRGHPGGTTLVKLLQTHLGIRNPRRPPPLTEAQILQWAADYRARNGKWPSSASGEILGAPGETWDAVDGAICRGLRGLPGGSSLAQLLQEKRGVRNPKRLPHLTEDQIAAWAVSHHARTGEWPGARSGEIAEAPGETWYAAANALSKGTRGLDGGTSLAKLLQDRHGVRIRHHSPDLTVSEILEWANRHRTRTGAWPSEKSGEIVDAPGETWLGVCVALRRGRRGIVEKTNLARLLRESNPPEPSES